ncbi:MAG TPA: hypothetical protein VNL37_06905 [Candidatus Polarisedimenticolia bacterium]|nr:hypothetical protein [Candidatus Polarisedimenticolia bacterium]
MNSMTRYAIPICLAVLLTGVAWSGPAIPPTEISPGPSPGPVVQLSTFLSRSIITDTIAHYTYRVRFGPGKYDVIGLHRIVMETAPFRPARMEDGVMLLHGDLLGFEGAFLGNLRSPGVPAQHSVAVYFAQNGMDVWGIDQGWTLVPADENDPSWAVGWGFDKELRGLDLGLQVARTVRAATGSGHGPLFLLGWSRGAQMALVQAGTQTRRPKGLRSVKGYVYGDCMFKFTDPAMRQAACDFYDDESSRIQAGDVLETSGSLFALLGELARTAPDDPSPVFEGLTNDTAALVLGSVPFGYPYAPNYHLVAGEFDAAGLPTGLQYSSPAFFLDWLTGASPYEPLQIEADGDAIGCERNDVPWDDGFPNITAPILFIEMAGGAGGDTGHQTLAFLPRADVTEMRIQLHPDDEAWLDMAHVDMWIADNAPQLLWKPVLDWMQAHR